MYEIVTLKCLCGNSRVHTAPTVDIADFLRCAIGDGWRRIDEDPVRAVECDRVTEIDLHGQCGNCAGVERFYASTPPAPRHFKTLREIIAARRRVA